MWRRNEQKGDGSLPGSFLCLDREENVTLK